MISSLRFIAHQGLPTRGHNETEGNFLQLIHLQSDDCPLLKEWIYQCQNWTSHDIQNELLEIMAHTVLRKITDSIRANRYYSIMVDESIDVSFKEQVSIYIHHVTEWYGNIWRLSSLYETGNTTAEVPTTIIKDVLCHCGLDLQGQANDGASNMSGWIHGVQARISSECPKAVYIHCFCHSLNFAVQDSSKSILSIRNALNVIQELSNLIKYSGKQKALLEKIRQVWWTFYEATLCHKMDC